MDVNIAILERMIGALFLVVVVIWVSLYFYSRFAGIKLKGDKGIIKVMTNAPLGPKKSIAVVKVAGEYLALGVTNDQINLLTRIDDSETIKRLQGVEECKNILSLNMFNNKAVKGLSNRFRAFRKK